MRCRRSATARSSRLRGASISNIWFGFSTARASHGYGPAPALGRKPCSSASTQCGNSKNRSARPPPSMVALPDGDLRRARPRVIAGAPRQFCAATCGARAAGARSGNSSRVGAKLSRTRVKILVHSGAKTALAGGGPLRFQRSRQNDKKRQCRGFLLFGTRRDYPEYQSPGAKQYGLFNL
jgi:hypothetical protein